MKIVSFLDSITENSTKYIFQQLPSGGEKARKLEVVSEEESIKALIEEVESQEYQAATKSDLESITPSPNIDFNIQGIKALETPRIYTLRLPGEKKITFPVDAIMVRKVVFEGGSRNENYFVLKGKDNQKLCLILSGASNFRFSNYEVQNGTIIEIPSAVEQSQSQLEASDKKIKKVITIGPNGTNTQEKPKEKPVDYDNMLWGGESAQEESEENGGEKKNETSNPSEEGEVGQIEQEVDTDTETPPKRDTPSKSTEPEYTGNPETKENKNTESESNWVTVQISAGAEYRESPDLRPTEVLDVSHTEGALRLASDIGIIDSDKLADQLAKVSSVVENNQTRSTIQEKIESYKQKEISYTDLVSAITQVVNGLSPKEKDDALEIINTVKEEHETLLKNVKNLEQGSVEAVVDAVQNSADLYGSFLGSLDHRMNDMLRNVQNTTEQNGLGGGLALTGYYNQHTFNTASPYGSGGIAGALRLGDFRFSTALEINPEPLDVPLSNGNRLKLAPGSMGAVEIAMTPQLFGDNVETFLGVRGLFTGIEDFYFEDNKNRINSYHILLPEGASMNNPVTQNKEIPLGGITVPFGVNIHGNERDWNIGIGGSALFNELMPTVLLKAQGAIGKENMYPNGGWLLAGSIERVMQEGAPTMYRVFGRTADFIDGTFNIVSGVQGRLDQAPELIGGINTNLGILTLNMTYTNNLAKGNTASQGFAFTASVIMPGS